MQVGNLQVIKGNAQGNELEITHLFGRVDMNDLWGPLRLIPNPAKHADNSPDYRCEMQNAAGAWVAAGAAWNKPYRNDRDGYWISIQLAPFANRPGDKWNLSAFPTADGESTTAKQPAWSITFRPLSGNTPVHETSVYSSL